MIIGDERVVRAIERFEQNFHQHADDFPYEIKTSIVRQIVRVGAIDTTAMIQAENISRELVTDSRHHFRVDTSSNPDVFYDGFVEFPTRNVDGTLRYGRYFVRDGIRHADIGGIIERIATESFVI